MYFDSGDRTFKITQIDIPNPDIVLWTDNKFSKSSIGPLVQFLQGVLEWGLHFKIPIPTVNKKILFKRSNKQSI